MSGLPSPTKVAAAHLSIYESYYKLVDPKNEGQIGALEAAKFLKKSHLSDIVLSKIWDIADPNSHGYLDKSGMFVALKLCALAQQGHNLNISNIFMDVPPPKMGDIMNVLSVSSCPQSTGTSTSSSCWKISPAERKKYEQLFLSLEPINGYIPGNKVKGVLMDSKLPLETLGKIWDLADMDKDGKLNLHEFTIAMHLVYKALEKNTVPNILPAELTADSSINNANDNALKLNTISSANLDSSELTKTSRLDEWVVSREDQLAADKLFAQADKDMDGFVSGVEIKDIFIQSGLPQSVLAHIWNLCDISHIGKLNNEQFALSMWLIKQKLNGSELPNKLISTMIPPSFKKKTGENMIENNNICTFSNPELNMLNRDISEIIQEKHVIEQDISQKEADIKIKTGEIKSLQSELDTLAATLRQLDNQKGEAQKRLNDLKSQVDKLRQQATDQESTLRIQEDELNSRRQEIESLKLTEQNLESHQLECKNQLNRLSEQLQNTQLQISQIKANMTQLEEQQHQIVDAITQYDSALSMGDALVVPESSLLFTAKIDESMYVRQVLNNITNKKEVNRQKDIFINDDLENVNSFIINNNDQITKKTQDPFEATFPVVPENSKDPFGDDPFAALHAPIRSDSPSPALPPKKSKQPPPRPAPPRPAQAPATILKSSVAISPATSELSNSDPFANKSFVSDVKDTFEFADFANFDSKTTSITDDSTAKYKLDENINCNTLVAKNLPDFEEDPFANYRYDDLSMISDPFHENEDFKKIKCKGKRKLNDK